MASKDREIIEFFERRPKESFYLRELSRRLDTDPGNLSRKLKQLVKSGKLTQAKRGNQLYFSLSSESAIRELPPELIRETLKRYEPEMVVLTQALIRIPSVSGEQPEEKVAAYLENYARSIGLKVRKIYKDHYRPNLVIDHEPAKPENFLFLGHMDTVGVGAIDNWRYFPFSAHAAGGRIYGRGAADMKAGIVCELFLLKLVRELGIDLPFNLRMLLVSNEEGGSTPTPIFDLGMDHLIKEGLVEGRAAVYGYGGSFNIGIGHRGVLRVKIATLGEAVHAGSLKSQRQERGANAVTAMAEILLALEQMKIRQNKHPQFPKHTNVITPGTMILHGGTAVSIVPDRCESVVEVRYLPGFPIRETYQRIKHLAESIAKKRGVRVDLSKFVEIAAVCLSPEEEIVGALKKALSEVYRQSVTARGYGPANESYLLIKRGIPTVVFGPIGGRAHADNEFVEIASLAKTVEVYLKTLLEMAKIS